MLHKIEMSMEKWGIPSGFFGLIFGLITGDSVVSVLGAIGALAASLAATVSLAHKWQEYRTAKLEHRLKELEVQEAEAKKNKQEAQKDDK